MAIITVECEWSFFYAQNSDSFVRYCRLIRTVLGWFFDRRIATINISKREEVQAMTRDEYLEFIRHQPYDSMGDFSFLLDEKADSSENTATQAVRDNMNAD